MENRGSEWKKWDLHLHSIYNNIKGCGDYNGISDEQFIDLSFFIIKKFKI